MKFQLGLLFLAILLTSCSFIGETVLLSSKLSSDIQTLDWEKEYWSDPEIYSYFRSENASSEVLVIETDSLQVGRWFKKVAVKPYASYKLSGYGKTENATSEAVGGGAGFNEFSRQSDIYYMANYAQTVNVIGAIKTTKTKSWTEATGLVLQLYNEQFRRIPIALEGDFKPLDIAATKSEDGQDLSISVINPTEASYSIQLSVNPGKIPSSGTRYTISALDDMLYNDENHQNRIEIQNTIFTVENHRLKVPKLSASIYVFKLN